MHASRRQKLHPRCDDERWTKGLRFVETVEKRTDVDPFEYNVVVPHRCCLHLVCSVLLMATDENTRIAVDPDVHFGKPCIAGTRIPVRDVLELVQEGLSFKAITTEYDPDLEEEDVKACVQYAIDTIDAEEIHVSTSVS